MKPNPKQRYEIGDLFATKYPLKHKYPGIGYITRIQGGLYIIVWFGEWGFDRECCYRYDDLTDMCVTTHDYYAVIK
jgi:hypothetical protein